jgi:hypothetical protein
MALSERVTLRPGMNDFNTNLPVDFRLTDDGYEVWSQLALDVLSPNAPIPAQSGGTMAASAYILDGGLPLTQTVADLTTVPHNPQIGGLPPATLLMAGDVKITTGQTPDPGPTPNPNPPQPDPPLPPVTPVAPQVKLPASARVKGRAATLPIRCTGTSACQGTVRIQSRPAKSKAKGKAVTYATRAFSLAAGASKQVKLTLSKAARRHRTLRAYANTTFADGTVASTRITLRR